MLRIVDLELWTKPRTLSVPSNGKNIAAVCRAETGLSEQVVLGLSFLPDHTDVENLRLALAAGELSQSEFSEFCAKHKLVPDERNELSASHFLAYAVGQPLAWLHFPAGPEGLAQANCVFHWTNDAGYFVVAGQACPPLDRAELESFWSR